MTDKELLHQMLQREVINLIESAAPQFRMFSGIASDYVFNLIEPYVDAFLSPDDGSLNKKAASAYLKQETNEKIDKFLKDFESKQREE
jgi:DNA-directed RNA polymerase specialized sigma24 family protein